MSAYVAFAGDASRKADLLARLEAHVAAGQLWIDENVWDGTNGRPTGCVAHSDDVKVFEVETGMPECLGMLFNFLHRQFQGQGDATGVAKANAYALDWMSRPVPGADLSRVPSDLVVRALGYERDDDTGLAVRCPDLARALARAIELHDKGREGRMPGRRDWAELRVAAVAATDAAEDKADKVVGETVEAICWNPLSSRGILLDLARSWVQTRHNRDVLASGWTAADQTRADTCLEALWNEKAAQREAGEVVDYPALFGAREPELEARFRAQLDIGTKAWRSGMAAFADLALDALGAAKSAAP